MFTSSDDLYITFRDFSNRFQYVPFRRNDKIQMNDIQNKNCTQIIHVPTWFPKHCIFLKPYLYYKSLPILF
jgi:hypothetical protein